MAGLNANILQMLNDPNIIAQLGATGALPPQVPAIPAVHDMSFLNAQGQMPPGVPMGPGGGAPMMAGPPPIPSNMGGGGVGVPQAPMAPMPPVQALDPTSSMPPMVPPMPAAAPAPPPPVVSSYPRSGVGAPAAATDMSFMAPSEPKPAPAKANTSSGPTHRQAETESMGKLDANNKNQQMAQGAAAGLKAGSFPREQEPVLGSAGTVVGGPQVDFSQLAALLMAMGAAPMGTGLIGRR